MAAGRSKSFFLKRHKKGNQLEKRIETILSEPSTSVKVKVTDLLQPRSFL